MNKYQKRLVIFIIGGILWGAVAFPLLINTDSTLANWSALVGSVALAYIYWRYIFVPQTNNQNN